MVSRRSFLTAVGAGIAGSTLRAREPEREARKKMAIVTTVWNYRSHAWHMGERFLVGYPIKGKWHRPPLDVVSVYVDQTPANDLSRKRAKEFGFTIYPKIAEALRRGGDKLAVDAVLIIGEHGDYPTNKIGQKEYPRYQFFKQVADVFKKDDRAVPVFNDKCLFWKKYVISRTRNVSPCMAAALETSENTEFFEVSSAGEVATPPRFWDPLPRHRLFRTHLVDHAT